MTAKRARGSSSREGILYLLVLVVLTAGWLMVMAARWAHVPEIMTGDLISLGVLAGSCLLAWLVFGFSGFKGDRVLVPLVLLLTGLGFLVQSRLGTLVVTDTTRASTLAYALGLISFFLAWMIFRQGRHAILAKWALPSLIIAVAVLGFIVATGQRFRGAVFLAGQVNPAELVKLLLVIFMAGVITVYRKPLQQTVAGIPAPPAQSLITLGVLWLLPMGLLMAQRDLGMIILLNTVFLVLLFMVTGRWGYLFLGGGAAALAGYAGLQLFSHARVRYQVWIDPFADPTGHGWQILQSLSAMFTGGMWGSGWGAGSPAIVPIATSDFVYAAFAEELGFVGCVLLVLVYVMIFYRGFRIADQMKSPFAQALAAGLTAMLALQTLMNIGGVTKAIPLTGITLPLISHGGSSLVTTLAMLGLLLALSEPAGKGAKRG